MGQLPLGTGHQGEAGILEHLLATEFFPARELYFTVRFTVTGVLTQSALSCTVCLVTAIRRNVCSPLPTCRDPPSYQILGWQVNTSFLLAPGCEDLLSVDICLSPPLLSDSWYPGEV